VNRGVQRTDIDSFLIPANEIAESLGNRRLVNMVILGALVEKLPIVSIKSLEEALDNHLPERHRKLLKSNFEALRIGSAFARGEFVYEGQN
jgi:2-oxoglutarate ferredoxin oxidoreductase subunit gamma